MPGISSSESGINTAHHVLAQHMRSGIPGIILCCLMQDNTVGLSKFAGPGGFNDPDMLEVRSMSDRLLFKL